MSFAAPEWFFLVPPLIVIGWRFRALRLFEPARAAALLACVLALANPQARMSDSGLDLWVLADRSDSSAAVTAAHAPEVESILRRSKRAADRVFFVDYAVDAVRRDQGDPVFRGGTHLTRTGAALDFALAQIETAGQRRASRLLLLGDGFSTEPLGDAAERVLRSGVPLDYRLTGAGMERDFRVERVAVPNRVLPGEAFLVEFFVVGSGAGADGAARVPWEVLRGGRVAASGEAVLRNGAAHVQLSDRLAAGGAGHYEVRIRPSEDAHPENNSGEAWVEVTGGPRALLVSNYPDDPLADLLAAMGFEVEHAGDPAALTETAFAGARLVVLNNVPAHRVGARFLRGLDFFVREQGGGLLMAGGENSFGAGGYFASPVDALLPVSMELRKEQRRLATAMAIVMDRSGSMAASAGGGQTKMDLANTGAARAIELLGDHDAVSVHAVDSTAHEVVPLMQVGANRDKLVSAVRRVASEGGGIFVGEGLRAGWAELQKAQTGQRHLILFADAADAEQPDDYKETLAAMRAEGATVSVIGMGTRADSDAALLEEIAALGGGRCFFGETAAELPAIFAQETVSVARSAFVKERTDAAGTAGWGEIAAKTPEWPPAVDGYNLSYLREGATASFVTTDEYQAPLVAAWSRGAGRVGAISFALGGNYSGAARAWSGLGDFEQTLCRWLAGEDVPQGLGLRTETSGGRLAVDLFYDESWASRIARSGPVAMLAESGAGLGSENVRALVWEKIEPGHFRATTELTPGRLARGVVRVGGSERGGRSATLVFGPASVSGSLEWNFDRARARELRQLSVRSGGVERLDLASVWDAPRPATVRSVRGWVIAMFIALALLDALLTRIGVRLARRRV
ncbi:hypothetical protein M2447_000531 [Ereboglobus sp. PH5-10]|uniref:vWA domain-containing protein n=1 Tax=Ereboglobus sp. PH5-10 TaxID=2940629 RepID=UPI002405290C|nr:VWA domain-containing protein [Ereboglobus sp. PH5-10]MDF9826450.1 hypothetical protein [Ereboglobus sp. PH5-10]